MGWQNHAKNSVPTVIVCLNFIAYLISLVLSITLSASCLSSSCFCPDLNTTIPAWCMCRSLPRGRPRLRPRLACNRHFYRLKSRKHNQFSVRRLSVVIAALPLPWRDRAANAVFNQNRNALGGHYGLCVLPPTGSRGCQTQLLPCTRRRLRPGVAHRSKVRLSEASMSSNRWSPESSVAMRRVLPPYDPDIDRAVRRPAAASVGPRQTGPISISVLARLVIGRPSEESDSAKVGRAGPTRETPSRTRSGHPIGRRRKR